MLKSRFLRDPNIYYRTYLFNIITIAHNKQNMNLGKKNQCLFIHWLCTQYAFVTSTYFRAKKKPLRRRAKWGAVL